MKRLYLDLRYVSSIPEAYKCSSMDIMTITGENIGNFAFRHALKYVVGDFDEYQTATYSQVEQAGHAGQIRDVVISCANWLGTSEQDEAANANRARAIEAVTAQVTCFGLGVQAKLGAALPKLGPNTARLAKVLAERAGAISVRDQLTQDTLESEGITNTVVTGCPSNFINGDPQLGAKIASNAQDSVDAELRWQDTRSLISEFSGGHASSGRVLADHLRLLRHSPAYYLIQSPVLLPLLLRETRSAPEVYIQNNDFQSREDVLNVLRAKMIHFASIDGWLDFSRTFDLSFGMRIHGTMIPLQAGVPSVLIAHDARTAGLAEQMGVPTLMPEEYMLASGSGPIAFFNLIAEAMDRYDARRAVLAQIMVQYLRSNGLSAHSSLLGLVRKAAPAHMTAAA